MAGPDAPRGFRPVSEQTAQDDRANTPTLDDVQQDARTEGVARTFSAMGFLTDEGLTNTGARVMEGMANTAIQQGSAAAMYLMRDMFLKLSDAIPPAPPKTYDWLQQEPR